MANERALQGPEDEQVYSFLATWFDPLPQLAKQYRLKFFKGTNEAEMVDVKTKRLFLKRSPCPAHMSIRDYYIGAKVVLYGRDLTLIDYGDDATRLRLTPAMAHSVFVLSPEAFATCGKLLDALLGTSLTLSKLKLFQLGPKHAARLSDLLSQQPEDDLAGHFSAHRVLAGVALGDSAVQSVCDVTRHLNDRSLSTGGGQVAWCAADAGAAAELLDFLFGQQQQQQRLGSTATFDSCTCCVIKPHAVKAGETGAILDHILSQGYEVSAVEMFHLDKASAAEFFEVYQGVAPEYKDLIDHMITSPCVALEVRAEEAVATFRQTAGPWDVEMAKELRPDTLRAIYGHDRVRSGVHCTELEGDGAAECRYFFELLQS